MASLKDFNHPDLLFPSKYLKAADLRGKRVPVVIESIDPRGSLKGKNGKDDTKPIVTLKGKDKEWVLNKTNATTLAKIYGNEVTAWLGKVVVLYGTRIQAGGEEVDAVRVDEAATRAAHEKAGNSAPIEHNPDTGEVESESAS